MSAPAAERASRRDGDVRSAKLWTRSGRARRCWRCASSFTCRSPIVRGERRPDRRRNPGPHARQPAAPLSTACSSLRCRPRADRPAPVASGGSACAGAPMRRTCLAVALALRRRLRAVYAVVGLMRTALAARDHPSYWAFLVHRFRASRSPLSCRCISGRSARRCAARRRSTISCAAPTVPRVKVAEWGLVVLLAAHLTGGLRILVIEFLPWDGLRKNWIASNGRQKLA